MSKGLGCVGAGYPTASPREPKALVSYGGLAKEEHGFSIHDTIERSFVLKLHGCD